MSSSVGAQIKLITADLSVYFSYPDIVVYLLYTTSFATLEEVKNYKSPQSYKYFTCGWMLESVWKRYPEEEIMLVMWKVRHSYAANKSPLRPWVLINCSGEILVAHCTCMAGLAETCSHVEALLHWVEAAVGISSNISYTYKENAWMPAQTEHIPSLELTEINFTRLDSAANVAVLVQCQLQLHPFVICRSLKLKISFNRSL